MENKIQQLVAENNQKLTLQQKDYAEGISQLEEAKQKSDFLSQEYKKQSEDQIRDLDQQLKTQLEKVQLLQSELAKLQIQYEAQQKLSMEQQDQILDMDLQLKEAKSVKQAEGAQISQEELQRLRSEAQEQARQINKLIQEVEDKENKLNFLEVQNNELTSENKK